MTPPNPTTAALLPRTAKRAKGVRLLLGVAAACAATLAAQDATAREVTGSLVQIDRAALPADARVMIVLRNAMGDVVFETLIETEGRQAPYDYALPDIPETALALQAGVFAEGRPIRVTPLREIPAGSEDLILDGLVLEPYVAMGFSTRLRCGRTEVELGFIDQIARLRIGREVYDMDPVESASGARFASQRDPDTWVWTHGDTAMISLRGRELPECVPSVGPAWLPLEARGIDTTWALRIDRAEFTFRAEPEGVEYAAPTPGPTIVEGEAGEVAGLRYDFPDANLRILLRDRICTGSGPLPRPVTVSVEEQGEMSEGCGGDPMALLSGGEWIVDYAGGTDIAPDLGVTMLFAPDRISGGSGCNRYSGGLMLRDRGLSVAGVALTRRACAPARMDVESLFLRQLAAISGFTLSDDGRLHLTDSAGNVLISAQR